VTQRQRILAALGAALVVVFVAGLVIGAVLHPGGGPGPNGSRGLGDGSAAPGGPTAQPTPVPAPGHEVYGFVPYWEMDDTIAAHVAKTDLTTLALFSVTNRTNGTIDLTQNGYKKIVGPIGQQLIAEAHGRGVRVELVFTSFGTPRNQRLFGGTNAAKTQTKVIAGLVDLVGQLRLDGIDVDVEQIDVELIPAYGEFVGRLRTALRSAHPAGQVSVATTANERGAAMAVAANAAGADRIFLQGYDYHYSGSAPGASAPVARRDGSEKDLAWSLDLYQTLGVPVQRTLLGLPLYGMSWPVQSPELGAPQTGKGSNWIPSDHLDVMTDPAIQPTLDPIEQVEQYTLPRLAPGASPAPNASPAAWTAVYVDSPATLTQKLGLADSRGLAGAGFWAIGYTRGLPAYTELIHRFHAGQLDAP